MRTPPRLRPPSLGFCLIALTWAATALLLAWGFSTPHLHRAWELTTRLAEENAAPPSPEEIRAVTQTLQRHPEWAPVLTSGRPAALLESLQIGCLRFPVTHLVVPASEQPIRLRLHCPPMPGLQVSLEGGDEISCPQNGGELKLPAAPRVRLVRVRRTAGPPVYRDDASCPATIETGDDDGSQPFDEDAPPEDGDAAKD